MDKKILLAFIMLLMSFAPQAWAYDFTVANEDGVLLKYVLKNDGTLRVTKASGVTYSGVLVIPDTVTYDGNTYIVTATEYFTDFTELTSVVIPSTVTYLGAFWGCSSLTSVIIPSSVTQISGSAFKNCTSLTSFTIPSSVTTLGAKVFSGCTGLTTFTIPDNVTTIGDGLFSGCTNLTSVVIGNGLTAISKEMFMDCPNLTSVTFGSNITSIKMSAFRNCTGLTSITIPASVTTIASDVFRGCTGLTSIHIPDGVTSLGANAFYECTGLTSATIGNGVTFISTSLFGGCSSLATVAIGNGVTSFDSYVFHGCSSLTSITISAGVTSIGSDAFTGCTSLAEVNFLGTPEQWMAISFSTYGVSNPVHLSHNLSFNGQPATHVEVPEGMTSVGSNFRYVSSLRHVIIPNSVTSIAANAFENCRLDSLTIGSGLTTIGSNAFKGDTLIYINYNCPANILSAFVRTRLATLIVGDAVTSMGANFSGNSVLSIVSLGSGLTSLPSQAFKNCTNLSSITLPDAITSIGSSAFYGCTSLTSINIPAGVTTIESTTFYNCSGLTSVTIPTGVTSIGSSAFYNCTGLNMVNYMGTPEQWLSMTLISNPVQYARNLYFNGDPFIHLEIPTSITEVPANFRYDTLLQTVVIPDHVTSIASYAFADCQLDSLTVGSGVTSIGSSAFYHDTLIYLNYNCTADVLTSIARSRLTTVIIGDQVTSLPNNAFYNCSNLTNVFIPTGLTSIGNYAFYGCSSLPSVNIPTGVTSIGTYVFKNCSGLSSITIPAGVTNIGYSAFENCSNLSSITIPAGVTSIGYSAFENCNGLTMVNFMGTPEQWLAISLNSNPVQHSRNLYFNGEPLTHLVIPDTVTTINTNFRYDTMLTHVVIGDNVTTLATYAFADCGLDSLTVGSGLTTIGGSAFQRDTLSYLAYGCQANIIGSFVRSRLATVVFLPPISTIGNNAFQNFPSLTTVVMSPSVNTIGSNAFRFCPSLTTVVMSPSLSTIGSLAFSNCASLTSITIPQGVTFIGNYAFTNCIALDSVTFNAVSCQYQEDDTYFGPFDGCLGITSFVFGDSVRHIPYALCRGLTGLTKVTIPGSVQSIGAEAFYNCTGLTETHYNGTVESWLDISIAEGVANPITYSRNLYLGDSLVTDLVIPGTFDTVSNNFRYDSALTSITISEGVRYVGSFQGCGHLTTVRIPNSVTNLPDLANTDIDSLFIGSGIERTGGAYGSVKYLFYNSDAFDFGWWSEGYYGTGGYVQPHYYPRFADLSKLQTLVIGDSVTTIPPSGRYLYGNGHNDLSGLRTVIIGSGLTYLTAAAFSFCSSLDSVIIPDNVTEIGNGVFGQCSSLSYVVIPNTVTYMGGAVFNNCTSLSSITLPDSLTAIPNSTFEGCTSLRNFTISPSITDIGESAFKNSGLTSISIPDSVTYIGHYAFRDCRSLDTLLVGTGLTDLDYTSAGRSWLLYNFLGDTISYLSYNCSIDLPGYLAKDSLRTVIVGENVSYIAEDAFAHATSLDSIVFLGENPPYLFCTASGVVPFNYLNLIRIPCGSYSDYYYYWYGNTTDHLIYDELNNQYYAWNTVLPLIMKEPQAGITFQALTADADRGVAAVWYAENWVSTADFPQPASCADSSVIVKGIANYGYHFDHWSDGNSANPRTVHLTGDSTLTAFFAPNQYTVTLQSSNNSYGTVNGGGLYTYLDTATISATAATHYHFLRWSDNNTDNPRQVVVEQNITLTAIFAADTHHVNVVANNAAYGTAIGTNDYAYGTTATLHATAAAGYYFVRWSTGSTANPTIITVTGDTTVMAIFSNIVTPELCMVSVQEDRNVLLWERENLPIVSYTVYREGDVAGQYQAIATVPYTDGGNFIDTASRPSTRSYRYRLTATDTCGNESEHGEIHKTMHLTINQGVGNTWNLVWTEYEGANYTTYIIYRGTDASNVQQIDIMPSGGNTTYTDNNAPSGEMFYQIGVVMTTPCGDAKLTTVSLSNIVSTEDAPDPYIPTPEESTIDFSDIIYWVGEGANQAVMAVNWADTALAWGYRWDGTATVSDMMADIAAADPRFSYELGDWGIEDILFVVAEGDTLRKAPYSYWESKNNGISDAGMGQTLANNDFEKWAEPAAGVVVDSMEYGGYWYYMYVYPMTIYPVSEPTISGVGSHEMSSVYAYPNPCTGTLYIVNEQAERIEFYDINGKLLEVVNSGETHPTLNMQTYSAGLYLLKVGNNVQKILKK